jgi:hypothetical protein
MLLKNKEWKEKEKATAVEKPGKITFASLLRIIAPVV